MELSDLKSSIHRWKSNRYKFNLGVLIFGLIGFFWSWDVYNYHFTDLLIVLRWFIGANLFYSSGILLEIADWHYFKNKIGFKDYRIPFAVIGFILGFFYTLWNSWMYFGKPYLVI